ncbi:MULTISPECIES: flagellar biosynthesis protein FlhF [unclassified Paraburkholderia]|uniref:flagellar biosynthesis protein FlhF n=1 Tax=unclassified Paraburkholderia TaxID=2615204 RepID=UPI001611105F|nr:MULTISPECIES: flagellar biosynthesis protein FlhF [unclassified Paraburkholderia]MBB5446052.1 flagellar biosynthesis protein FlhF [Paraburkholderia sp. WSM4177]MBB5486517.1 flagellar biosynthesis protein FlhF [Paraburkholderia sp. WSM4180]
MNIRKFVGATSRDALRLVREALGPDAVVLSNRTMDDGSVEIVALADSDLAAITPKAREGAQAAALGTGSGAASTLAPRGLFAAPTNPYASAMPDVFSSVFGASPEAGGEATPAIEPANAAADFMAAALPGNPPVAPAMLGTTGASAAIATGAAPAVSQSASSAATSFNAPATGAAAATPSGASARAAAARLSKDIRADLLKAAGGPVPPAIASSEAAAPRTMAESNPWLIDHARRIAAEQQQQSGQYSARPAAMTPAVATAKGLGSAVDARPAAVPPLLDTPDWAREAAEVAARRAAQKIAPVPSATDESRTPSAVAEAIKGRMEQVVKDTVMNELSSMRDMMEEHFAGLLWGDRQRRSPARAALTKHLFAAGFSAQLVQMLVDNLPEDVDTMDGGMDWVRSVLESNLPVMEDEDALMERGGVFALMGPTGVGKTTTTAKLAARCVMRFGASKVALLTTDSYRIGGHEQLRIFGKILGVSVHAVKDSADLQLALSELRNKHIVLIDTIGMSQRDRLVSDQIAMLSRAGQPVQRLLLLNATSHGDTLNEVVQAYQRAPDQQPLAGCILTKLDEATNLGGVLDTVIRYKLPVHYVSTGQKVPENLYVATKKFLIKSTFCIPRDNSPFVPHDDDIPALLSSLSARSTAELHEVRFG